MREAKPPGEGAELRQVKQFWSDVMTDDEARMQDRLKASELLAKTAAPVEEPVTAIEVRIDYGDGGA